ncbi:hypothetical protein D9758_002010 [Tetrapyrgos nigripes]|uniref:Mei2-like C-terminal RNA recognition motif domain-containing protein n=1 Tax=Tetrapyrgos nigripes TaxID=182062 RepID=A0A8H5GT85_9AGAR|nr:hypothetical protein D9758_002010 [Tetrapyrgos nigripes]
MSSRRRQLATPPLTPSSSIQTTASRDSTDHSLSSIAPGDCDPTRFLLVGNVSPVKSDKVSQALCANLTSSSKHDTPPIKGIFVRLLENGVIIIAFFDLRDAIAAKELFANPPDGLISLIADENSSFTCNFVPVESLVAMVGNSDFLKSMDASFFVTAVDQSMENAVASLHVTDDTESDTDAKSRPVNVPMLKRFLEAYGPVRSFAPAKSDAQSPRTFRVEFFDIRDVSAAYEALEGVSVFGMKLRVFGRDYPSSPEASYPTPVSASTTDNLPFSAAGQHSQTRERFHPAVEVDRSQTGSPSPATADTDDDNSKSNPSPNAMDARSKSPAYFYDSNPTPPELTVRAQPSDESLQSNQKSEPKASESDQSTSHASREQGVPLPLPVPQCYAPHMDGSIYPSPEHLMSSPVVPHPYYVQPPTPPIPFHPTNYLLHPQAQAVYPHTPFMYDYDAHVACQAMNMGMVTPWPWDSGVGMMYPPLPAYPGSEYWCHTITPTPIPHVAPYMQGPPALQMNGQPSYFPAVPAPTELPPIPVFPGTGSVSDTGTGVIKGPTPSPPFTQISAQRPPPRVKPPSRGLVHHTAPNPNSSANGNSKENSERNQLNLARIEDGQDTRTTIMIKNIPNKMTDKDLVTYINKVIPRRIDFLYLRMDFSNGCNVGYAFVNFITVQDLLTFAKKRLGHKWNMFSSEKVLQMSYANYQGKEALVEKFKNSCIMDECEAWQPKIFYSEPGPEQGLPEPFPAATHQRRKERSSHNRGALFVPGSGGGVGPSGGIGLLHHANYNARKHGQSYHERHDRQEDRARGNRHRQTAVEERPRSSGAQTNGHATHS